MKNSLLLFLRGIAMGAVDLIPGVSAGTIAFITGIYVELVTSIKSFNLEAIRILKAQGMAATWQHLNGNFLATLLAGILVSLFSLAGVMKFFLINYPLPLWSFFTGLIVASVIFLLRQYPLNRPSSYVLLCLGVVFAYGISIAPVTLIEANLITMFFAGSIALCAMILPGISGSFILVLLGLYPVFIDALVDVKLDILAVFAMGGVIGLMLFSRLLSWLLDHYLNWVIATMCGFLMGSLTVIWPWKLVTETMLSHSGKTIVLASENILPHNYYSLVGQDPQTTVCVMALLGGFCLLFAIEYLGDKFRDELKVD